MTSSAKTTTSNSTAGSIPPPASVKGTSDRFKLIGDYFPILICASPAQYSETTVREMGEAFEEYFVRGTRYVVIAVTPNRAEPPDAKQRKHLTDWINSPRVKGYSARLCLGSANIVPSALARGLHTALLWAWSPPFPLKPVASAREAVDYSIETLEIAGVPLPASAATGRVNIQRRLQAIMG